VSDAPAEVGEELLLGVANRIPANPTCGGGGGDPPTGP
jgi:hypothetical protein